MIVRYARKFADIRDEDSRKGAKNMSGLGRTAEVDAPAHLNRTDTTPTDLSEQMKKIAEARNRPTAKS